MPIPTELPTPEQLELPRAWLSELMHELTVELMHRQADLLRAVDTREFAAAVLRTADRLAEASARWGEMSSTIRESWEL
jgi:hypothetical protein